MGRRAHFVAQVMKAVVAKYDAVELITQRAAVSQEIRERLTERASHYYLVLSFFFKIVVVVEFGAQ